MQIVIEIDNEHYDRIMRFEAGVTVYPTTLALYEAVKNGTPLPEGHGDLKDADAIVNGFDSSDLDNSDPIENYSNACNIINSYPVIVPADKR